MSAQPLQFRPYLQNPLDEGVLTPHQAWLLMWDLEQFPTEPWSPGVQPISRLVQLFHLNVEQLRPN